MAPTDVIELICASDCLAEFIGLKTLTTGRLGAVVSIS